jgi:hypothetical protein
MSGSAPILVNAHKKAARPIAALLHPQAASRRTTSTAPFL